MGQQQAANYGLTKNLMGSEMRLCLFNVPAPFSKERARWPLSTDEYAGFTYPGVCWLGYREDAVVYLEVRCIAMLINLSKSWWAHPTRVTIVNGVPPAS